MSPAEPTRQALIDELERLRRRCAELEADRGGAEFHRTIVQAAPGYIFRLTPDCRVLFVNASGARQLGQPVDRVAGRAISDIFPPAMAERMRQNVKLVAATGRPLAIEAPVGFDGNARWFRTQLVPEFDEQGRVKSVLGFGHDIGDLKRVEQELRDSQERAHRSLDDLLQIYRTAPVGLCVLDTELRFVKISDRLAAYAGRPPQDHLGRTIREMLPTALADLVEPIYRKVLQTGEPQLDVELTTPAPADPEVSRDWLISCHPCRDESDRMTGVSVVVQEITQHRQAQRALAASEKRLRDLTDALPVFIAFVGADERFQYVNDAYARERGRRPEELIGMRLKDMLDEQGYASLRPKIDAVLSGRLTQFEYDTIYPRRARVYRMASYVPAFNNADQVVGFYICVTDITPLKMSERALAESHAQLRLIADSLPEQISYINRDMRIEFANQSVADNAGRGLDQVVGRSLLEIVPPQAREAGVRNAAEALRGKRVDFEVRRPDLDGRMKDMSVHYIPDVGEDGSVKGFFVSVIDVTELRRAERLQAGRNLVLEQLAAGADSSKTLRAVVELVESFVPGARCTVMVTDESARRLWVGVAPSFSQPMQQACDGAVVVPGAPCYIRAALGEAVFTDDLAADRLPEAMAIHVQSAGLKSCWSQPIPRSGAEERVLGTLNLFFAARRVPDAQEREFLRSAAQLASVAISHIRAHRAMKATQKDLETQVARRTAELAESEQRFRMMIEISLLPLAITRRSDGMMLYANRAFEQMMGERPGGWKGRRSLEYYARTQDRPDFLRTIAEKGHVLGAEQELKRIDDGGLIWVMTNLEPMSYQGEEALLCGFYDITERRRMEQQLAERERLYRSLIQTASSVIICLDEDRRIWEWNRAAEKTLGYTRQEAMGKEAYELLLLPEHRTTLAARRLKLLAGRDEFNNLELLVRAKDGTLKTMLWNSSRLTDSAGRPIGTLSIGQDISERRAMEDALAQREAHYRSLVETAGSVIICSDTRGCVTEWNPEAERIYGLSREEVLGTNPMRLLVRPEQEADAREVLERALAGEIVSNLVFPMTAPDGQERILLGSVTPLRDPGGRVIGLLHISHDITELRRVEEALRQSEERYRLHFENATDVICEIDAQMRITAVSPSVERILGYRPDELAGRRADELPFADPSYVPKAVGEIAQVLSGKVLIASEYQFLARGGRRVFGEISSSPLQKEGRIIGIIVVARDVTDRMLAERELRNSERANRALLDAIPDLIFRFDEQGHILDYLASHRSELAVPPERFLGKTMQEALPQPVGRLITDRLHAAFKTQQMQRFEYSLPVPVPDGEIRHFEARLVVTGEREAMAIVRNITERKRSEEQLLAYQEQLRSLASELALTEERGRRRIAAELHDRIGQALAFCKIKLGLLKTRSRSGEAALAEVRKLIEQTIRDTRTLIFELSPPILYELGLEPAAEWLLEQVRDQHDIEVRFEDDGQNKPLSDDLRVLLFQGIRELLVNVVKHAQAGRVSLRLERLDDRIRIEVRDNGKGIARSRAAGRSADQPPGFGLFSLRTRLELLGGDLHVTSRKGRGTLAVLTAPLRKDEPDASDNKGSGLT
ncbi:MAG: hypothetical protein BIFFINMI_00739 [Phycisphaerae bacterium]|nr:hypothetical protein [Phycisphaerae bacterium]